MHSQAQDVVVAGLGENFADTPLNGSLAHVELGRDLFARFGLARQS